MFKKDGCLRYHASPHSPHMIIPEFIPKKSEVLDVGCNTGFLAKHLGKNNVVDGIDINEKALKIAKKFCRNVYKRDLYKNKLDLPRKLYDVVVFADILEHLPQPDLILTDTRKYLKNNGIVLISLPNIARIELRIKHLLGDFTYAPGIIGYDHLRFFTKKTASKMIESSGYTIKKIIPTGLGHMIGIFPELTAFQFVFVCQK